MPPESTNFYYNGADYDADTLYTNQSSITSVNADDWVDFRDYWSYEYVTNPDTIIASDTVVEQIKELIEKDKNRLIKIPFEF